MTEKAKAPNESAHDLDEVELELFVSKTLKAVVKAIADAERFTRPENAHIVIEKQGAGFGVPLSHRVSFGLPSTINFDVAVNVARKSGRSGGLKIEVLNVGGSLGAEAGKEKSLASRVSFAVPLEWKNSPK